MVDDDPTFRGALCELLADDGFAVRPAASLADVPDAEFVAARVVIVGDHPAGAGAAGFVERVRRHRPGLPSVLLTALCDEGLISAARAAGILVLPKLGSYDTVSSTTRELASS